MEPGARRQTLILQGSPQGSFAVAADWTDWAPCGADATRPTILDADALQALVALVQQLLPGSTGTRREGVAK